MDSVERETVICLNDRDLEDGFFFISTSKPSHLSKIKKRCGKLLISIRHYLDIDGKAVYWDCKVDKRGFQFATLGLKLQGKAEGEAPKVVDPMVRARMDKIRAKKGKK